MLSINSVNIIITFIFSLLNVFMATNFVSVSLMMYMDGTLKHNGASQALHQNVMANSGKAKFFTVKKPVPPHHLMMHETDISFCV